MDQRKELKQIDMKMTDQGRTIILIEDIEVF